jgi:septum formation protein
VNTAQQVRLVLASASPARRRTLQAAGIDAEVRPSGVDESDVDHTDPQLLCAELAQRKAYAVAAELRAAADPDGPDGAEPSDPTRTLVLGCDSMLAFQGEVVGKPADADEARARWRRMRGRHGVLHTGHCVVDLSSGRTTTAVAATRVSFAAISDAEIDAYVATGEPLAVAGAFTIDGLGAAFVESVEGDPGTVVGLSMPLLRLLLAEFGVPITALWRGAP